MTQRMNRLPPHMRSLISRQISERGPHGMVTITRVLEAVRSSCPDTITDRELEDAIAEEAVAAGLAVHFDHPSGAPPVKQTDAREGP